MQECRRFERMELDWSSARITELNADVLRDMLAVIMTQARDVSVSVEADGTLSARAVSPDHVTLVDVGTDKGFVTGNPAGMRFGIDAGRWLAALKRFHGRVRADWIPGAVKVAYAGMDVVFRLDEPEAAVRMPSMEMDSMCMLDPAPLRELASMVESKTSAYWRMTLSPDGLRVSVRDETGIGPGTFVPEDDMDCLDAAAPVSAAFPWSRWKELLNALPDCPVGIEMDSSYPCRVTFGGDGWSGQWICAPIIEQEDA